jgi:hypothetical protein
MTLEESARRGKAAQAAVDALPVEISQADPDTGEKVQ